MSSRGMRSILKVQSTPLQHLRNKLSAGLYDKGEYPFSYDILSLNPPVADPPGAVSDFKYSDTKGNIVLPTDSLVKAYLKRQGNDASKEYYTRPEQRIGLGDVDPFHSQVNYKGSMADAYYFAQRQHQYMQQNHDAELTEEECVKAVEQILQQDEQTERISSRQVAKTVRSEVAVKKTKVVVQNDMNEGSDEDIVSEKEATSDADMEEDGTIPSVLHGNTNALMQMTQWGDRLSQVPYNRWTVGAATALDHWIAITVLGLSEHAWQDVLHRKDRSRSRAQDVITVRHALFPETLQGHDTNAAFEGSYEDDENEDEEKKAKKEAEKSIDELLASLGGDDESDDFWKNLEGANEVTTEDKSADDEDVTFWSDEGDESFIRMRKELKNWQARNVEVPYAEWEEQEKKAFNNWLVKYASAVHSSVGGKDGAAEVDLDETRNAIFQEPYFSEEQDEMMWSALSEDVEAELVLQQLLSSREKLLADGVLSRQEYDEWESFTELSYREQLRQIRGLSALQPIREGDVPEAQVQDFVSKNVALLCDDVSMEELVPDQEGAITAKDLFNLPEDEHRFKFRTTNMEADSGLENIEHDEKLFRDMGLFHANVANHEEALFEDGELNLERSSKAKREQQKSSE